MLAHLPIDPALAAACDQGAIESVGEEDVMGLDLLAEGDGEVEVLGVACVAQAAHGFVGEDAGERLCCRCNSGKPHEPLVFVAGVHVFLPPDYLRLQGTPNGKR